MVSLKSVAPTPAEDEDLVERCRQGDEAACRALYARYARPIFQLAYRLGTPPAELEDVVQETFSNAFSKLSLYQGGTFSHWLFRVCANVATDAHRRRRVRRLFGSLWEASHDTETPHEQSPEGLALRGEAGGQVSEILSRMRPAHREVFVLFECERLSGEEIAQRLGCTPGTVRTRLFRAREAFQAIGRKLGYVDPEGGQ